MTDKLLSEPLPVTDDKVLKMSNRRRHYLIVTCRNCWPVSRTAWVWMRMSVKWNCKCYRCGGKEWQGPYLRKREVKDAWFPERSVLEEIETPRRSEVDLEERANIFIPTLLPKWKLVRSDESLKASRLFLSLAMLSDKCHFKWLQAAHEWLSLIGFGSQDTLRNFWIRPLNFLHFSVAVLVGQESFPSGVQVFLEQTQTIIHFQPYTKPHILTGAFQDIPLLKITVKKTLEVYVSKPLRILDIELQNEKNDA